MLSEMPMLADSPKGMVTGPTLVLTRREDDDWVGVFAGALVGVAVDVDVGAVVAVFVGTTVFVAVAVAVFVAVAVAEPVVRMILRHVVRGVVPAVSHPRTLKLPYAISNDARVAALNE